MTVQELIDLLKEMNPEAIVVAYNADDEDVREVTGALHSGPNNTVELTTDDIT